MQVLITGGAGFIGSNLANYLHDQGHTITILDNFSTGSTIDYSKVVNFGKITVGSENRIAKLATSKFIEDADVVIHLAATVGVKNVMDNPLQTIFNNIGATEEVIDCCHRFNKRCIIASTSEVYGKNINILHEEDDTTYGPSSKSRWSYAVSKLIDEFIALYYFDTYQLPITAIRFFNVSGPGQVSKYGMVIPKFIDQAKANERITIFGDGSQRRSFTHIEDVVKILSDLLLNEKSYGQILNIGNPEEVTIKDLAEHVKSVTNSSSELVYHCEGEVYNLKNFEDMVKRTPSIERLSETLGYTPQFRPYTSIVSSILEWQASS